MVISNTQGEITLSILYKEKLKEFYENGTLLQLFNDSTEHSKNPLLSVSNKGDLGNYLKVSHNFSEYFQLVEKANNMHEEFLT